MLNLPYLPVPFRTSKPLALSNAVKQYICSKYDQHPDMFSSDLATIDQLRTSAITVQEPHISGVQKLAQYAAHLQWISGKFPIDIGADFTWSPSLGYNTSTPITQNNLQFERANILFNLGALYANLANQSPRTDAAGLKTACNYYMAAAGTFKYIESVVLPELRSAPPEDMDAVTLACLEQLMLAQAQECFWLKAVKDGNKDSLIARLAASIADYYDQAAEFGTNADAITSEWVHHMGAKHSHFAAAAQYRASEDCLNRSKYGEQVARLKEALSTVNDAVRQHGRYLNATVKDDLLGLKEKVMDVLKGAEKDNDIIYLETVPPTSALPRIQRASMVKSTIPTEIQNGSNFISDSGPFGPPLFTKLVPFAVSIATSIYTERRDRLINETIIGELATLTAQLHDLLQSLNLPGSLHALEKPLGLPPAIIAHADDVRQQGGINKLYSAIADIEKLKSNDTAIFRDAAAILQAEAAEDEQLRLRHGTARWTRPSSAEAAKTLKDKVAEYENILRSADESDKLVRRKLETCEGLLRLLGGGLGAIEEFVPNSVRATLTPKVDREVAKLRQFLNEVSRLESRRRKMIEEIRGKAKEDDITPSILLETSRLERANPPQPLSPTSFEPLISSRLETLYTPLQTLLTSEAASQSTLITQLRDANTSFLASRRVDTSLRQREEALQKLENAYAKYRELGGNLETGRKFYNDLAKLLQRFVDECAGFVGGRRREAGVIEVDITASMHNLRINEQERQQERQHELFQQQQQQRSPPPQAHSPQFHPSPQKQQRPPQTPTTPAPTTPQTPRTPAPATPVQVQQPQQAQQQQPRIPQPGLWHGDASTPIRFAPPPPK